MVPLEKGPGESPEDTEVGVKEEEGKPELEEEE